MLPNNSMAVLPVLGDGADDVDFEIEEGGKDRRSVHHISSRSIIPLTLFVSRTCTCREVPYAPSYAVDLATIDPRIRNVQDVCFLPGFHSPTIAILFQTTPSWAK